MRFRQMYNETPLCCPARATFLTGRHTFHHGVTRNDGDLLDASTTVAVALHAAGYHTIQAGKYLNGYTGDRSARRLGPHVHRALAGRMRTSGVMARR